MEGLQFVEPVVPSDPVEEGDQGDQNNESTDNNILISGADQEVSEEPQIKYFIPGNGRVVTYKRKDDWNSYKTQNQQREEKDELSDQVISTVDEALELLSQITTDEGEKTHDILDQVEGLLANLSEGDRSKAESLIWVYSNRTYLVLQRQYQRLFAKKGHAEN